MAVLFDVVIFSNRCMKAVRHHAILTILAGLSCCFCNLLISVLVIVTHLTIFRVDTGYALRVRSQRLEWVPREPSERERTTKVEH